MAKAATRFVVSVDSSVSLSKRARAELAMAMGSSAASALARLDLKGTPAFIPRIDWPGGYIVDLARILPAAKVRELRGKAIR